MVDCVEQRRARENREMVVISVILLVVFIVIDMLAATNT